MNAYHYPVSTTDTSAGKVAPDHTQDGALCERLLEIRRQILDVETRFAHRLGDIHEHYRAPATNLVHYTALRSSDLRDVQHTLATRGLSSLGRSEAAVLDTIDKVLRWLGAPPNPHAPPTTIDIGRATLLENTRRLLGPGRGELNHHVMVTMPSEAADDPSIIDGLLDAGMTTMRINTAHDDEHAWERMVRSVRDSRSNHARGCKVLVDLAGPKLRTGPIEPGPPVIRWQPVRDALGRAVAPARLWLYPDGAWAHPDGPTDARIPVRRELLERLDAGDLVRFRDARDKQRSFRITSVGAGGRGAWAESFQTAYLINGTTLTPQDKPAGTVGDVPRLEQAVVVRTGDALRLIRGGVGRPAVYDRHGKLRAPASIPCTLDRVFADLRVGHAVWFDDGKVGCVVESVTDDEAMLRVTRAKSTGQRIRSDKGINLPETELHMPSLTEQDRAHLAFCARHADIVSLSFVRTAQDVRMLQDELARIDASHLGVVAKIETRQAFENLPDILLQLMGSPAVGVMIARGDLAVECGFERMAEVQEEILWLCEAAHVPAVWATQVLDRLARRGQPTRAEITDAAMSARAECVMLNKGPYVVEATRTLRDVLERMHAHQSKKRPMLRPLAVAERFVDQTR